MTDDHTGWARALRSNIPRDCDLAAARSAIETRTRDSRPVDVVRPPRSKRPWMVAGGIAALVAALAGSAQFVNADQSPATVTADGTRLGQALIEARDPAPAWQVKVTKHGNNYCVETGQNTGSGGMCRSDWSVLEDADYPPMQLTPFAETDGHPVAESTRVIITVVAPTDRPVIARSNLDAPETDVNIDDLPGVHHAEVQIQGKPFDVWALVAEGKTADEATGRARQPFTAFYVDGPFG